MNIGTLSTPRTVEDYIHEQAQIVALYMLRECAGTLGYNVLEDIAPAYRDVEVGKDSPSRDILLRLVRTRHNSLQVIDTFSTCNPDLAVFKADGTLDSFIAAYATRVLEIQVLQAMRVYCVSIASQWRDENSENRLDVTVADFIDRYIDHALSCIR